MSRVLVVEAHDYSRIDEIVERFLEEFPLEVRGRSVLLKPNIVGPYEPDTHINTHPEMIRALVEALRAGGARVTVSDNPGVAGYGAVEKCGRVSGILEASMGAFENLGTDVVDVELPGRGTTVKVSKKVMETDILINLPKMKTHVFTRISGAVKNCYGFIVGGDKARLHCDIPGYRDFSDVLTDIYALRVPDLTIMDGVVALQGNGPTNKDQYPAGLLLASGNGVELDSVMTHMMRMKPEKVRMLERARELGLGETDLQRIDIEGPCAPLKRFRRPFPGVPQRYGGRWIKIFFPDIGRPAFDVAPELCTFCGQCAEVCPANAIEVEKAVPEYACDACIACFCCMELCPKQAITLHDTLATRIYRRMGYL